MAAGSFASRFTPKLDLRSISNVYVNENGVATYYTSQPVEVLISKWYSSAKTASYKMKKPRELPENPFQGGARVRKDSGGFATQPIIKTYWNGEKWVDYVVNRTWSGTARFMFPGMYNVLAPLASWDSSPTKNAAEQKALTQCANTKINVAQAFAERKQTAGLLVSSVNRFVQFAVLLKKGNFRAANKVLKGREQFFLGKKYNSHSTQPPKPEVFSNLWLEYSYGWRPLLNDIHGAAELLAQQFTETRPTKVEARVQVTDSQQVFLTESGLLAKGVSKVNCSAISRLFFDVADYERDLLKQTGIANPALLAWELLPYSFVADWFIPVGAYLTNLEAASGLKFLHGSTSVRTSIDSKSFHEKNVHQYSLSGFNVEEKYLVVDRYVLSTWPKPTLPKFSLGLNFSQAISGVALIQSAFARRGSKIVYLKD